jgi:hypothetical protein
VTVHYSKPTEEGRVRANDTVNIGSFVVVLIHSPGAGTVDRLSINEFIVCLLVVSVYSTAVQPQPVQALI